MIDGMACCVTELGQEDLRRLDTNLGLTVAMIMTYISTKDAVRPWAMKRSDSSTLLRY